MEEKNPTPPVKTIKYGCVQATIWLHPTRAKKGYVEIPTVRISRSHRKEEDNKWVNSEFFNMRDLPLVLIAALEAWIFLKNESIQIDGDLW